MELTQAINLAFAAFLFACVAVVTTEYMMVKQRRRRAQLARAHRQGRREATGQSSQERARSRLTRQAIEILLANNYVHEGIPLASMVGVTEVLADREMRSNTYQGRPPLITMADGRRATISRVVELVRENGPTPDALPGPSVVELLESLSQQQRRAGGAEPFGDSGLSVAELMIEEFAKLEDKKKKRNRAEESSVEEVYGKGSEYTHNPANVRTENAFNHLCKRGDAPSTTY
ncbi:hypothetical protein DPX39_040078800 [Trypanosoma brucei equiperdum]|uniref:Uncharacterized protein n=1 Tax=Trypanosoma brucei equiperdum TaxID=630700 RepID=A0A3L6LCG5_9TRYP|nr:hypothetical protein DPX39_040078800 [Trypanosoma brucei equiperdum]